MLNTVISGVFLIAIITNSIAQNLVVNPSFEITNSNCSNFGGEGFRTDLDPSWDNANSNIPGDSCSSPDLFSACNPFATNMPDATSFGIGWQYSRTGTRHAGFIAYSAPFGFEDQYREYIQGHTASPLIAGQTYCVSFYLSLSDGSPFAVEDIGVHFTNSHYLRDACTQGSLLNLVPQLENNCGVLSDTMNWVRLQWDYVAAGGEQYFIIGNFKNDANTNHANANGNGFGNYFAYYFLDDVSIVSNSCCYTELDGPTSLCPADGLTQYTASPGINPCGTSITGTWSGTAINSVTGVFDPNAAGMGTHTLTFNADCGTSTSIDVTVAPCMDVCLESNGDLTVNGGTGPFEWSEWVPGGSTPITNQSECESCGYTWFFGNCLDGVMPVTSCNTPAGYQVFATGTTVTPSSNFPIQVEDANNNIITLNDLNGIPACGACPTITIGLSNVNDISCNGLSDGSATALASGGVGPYTYDWNPGSLSGANQSTLNAGNYTVLATDLNGCTGTTNFSISEPLALSASSSSNDANCGASDGSASVNASGGTGALSYSWSPGGQTTNSVSNLSPGNYLVTITDANGCSVQENINIGTINGPTLNVVSSSDATCFGFLDGSATVSATGGTPGYTYNWQPGNLIGPSQSNLSAGTYTVTVTDNIGCTASTPISISEPTEIQITEAITAEDCGQVNGEIAISVNGGSGSYAFEWSPNGETSSSLNNILAGTYTLEVTDGAGCTSLETFVVPQIGGPNVVISPSSATINEGEQIMLNASGANTYTWTPSSGLSCTTCPSPIASPLTTTTYIVSGIDGSGCIGNDTITIIVIKDCADLFVPTIFSPNQIGPDANNTLCVWGECITDLQFRVFNRWGELVFESTETVQMANGNKGSVCWDGLHRGKPVSSGSYVYTLNARMNDSSIIEKSGNITLTR